MNELSGYCPLVVGILLALSAAVRAMVKDKFGTPGMSLLVFGFLFAALPFAKNLQMSGLGLSVKVEALEKQVQVANGKAAEANSKANLSAVALRESLDSSRAVTECMDRLWSSGIIRDGSTRELIARSQSAIDRAESTLSSTQ